MTDSESRSVGGHLDDDLDMLAGLLDAHGIADDARIKPRAADAAVPMSFSQELLWLLDRATPGMYAYNLPLVRRLRGRLDVAALERALTLLAARHEMLRTRFAEVDGAPRLLIDPPAPVTLRKLNAASEAEAQRIARERGRTPFDLAHEHLFRPSLITLADDDNILLLESHHIVLDGWSLAIVYRELSAAYDAFRQGQEPSLPPITVAFGDFAIWQREHLGGERMQTLVEFWREQLGGATEPLGLPTDFARTTVPTFSGGVEVLVLPKALTEEIQSFAKRNDATTYMVLLAAYATVLSRYTGQENVLIGSGSAGRSLETESIVGYLNNTLVQRASFAGDPTLAELLSRVRASAIDAYDHQEIPLERLVQEIRGTKGASEAPLFDVVLTMEDTIPGVAHFGNLDIGSFDAGISTTKFDITLLVTDRPDGLHIRAQYRSDLFAQQTIARFLGHLSAVLTTAVQAPDTRVSAVQLLTADELQQLASANNTSADEGPSATALDLFAAQVARVAGREAVNDGASTLTYAELNARADALAGALVQAGAKSGQVVGLLLDRSVDAIVALIGIMKSGAAYMPLATDAPAARIATQLKESGATIVVAGDARNLLPAGINIVAPSGHAGGVKLSAAVKPEHPAYVLYTSGSTGTPKGVVITHANIVHYARAVSRVFGDGFSALDGLHCGFASSLAADLGNTSLYLSLFSGGTLHVLGKDVTTEPARFAEYVGAHPLDVLKITPNHFTALTSSRQGAELRALMPRRWLITGGEALRIDTARTFLAAGPCRVLNHYGPTEVTVGACTFQVTTESLDAIEAAGAQTVPIGAPLVNTHAYVVDARGSAMPFGIPGELWLGGTGVAQGYLNRAELTAERFVSHNGERVYRTGDRVRRLANGPIEFLGRVDHQVKVRGYRVELGEVENVLRSHPGVQDVAVILGADTTGAEALAAYVVPKGAGYAVSHSDRPTAEKLVEWAATELPSYMVPSFVHLLDALPLTANGKLDRAALPQPGAAAVAGKAYVEPKTETEKQLADIWKEVLKQERVGLSDNFLELGGHSLLAIRVLGRISRAFGVRLPLRTLFDAPTVESLAAVIDKEKGAKPAAEGGITARSRDAHRIT